MLKIRLARVGKKKKPTYRFIVSESARDTYGKALEILGHYDPFRKVTEVKKERILHWISQGAQLTPTVHNMLVDQNVISADKVRASKSKKKKGGEEAAAPAAPAAEGEAPAEGATDAPAPEAPKEEAPADAPAEEKKEDAPAPEEKTEDKPAEEPAAEEKKEEEKSA